MKYRLVQTAAMINDPKTELRVLSGGQIQVKEEGKEPATIEVSAFTISGDTADDIIRKSLSNVIAVMAAVLAYENGTESKDELNKLYIKYLPTPAPVVAPIPAPEQS